MPTDESKLKQVWRQSKPVMVGLTLVGVLGAGVFVARYVFANAYPKVDYLQQLNDLAREAQPEGENAWPDYRRILIEHLGRNVDSHLKEDAITPANEAWSTLMLDEPIGGAWSAERADAIKPLMDTLHPVFVEMGRAAALPGFFAPYGANRWTGKAPEQPTPLVETDLVSIGGAVRSLAYMNTQAIRYFAETGDWPAAVEHLRTSRLIARQLSLAPTFLEMLIASSSHVIPTIEIRRVLNDHNVPIDVCETLFAALAETPWLYDERIRTAIKGERLFMLDALQWMYSDGGVPLLWTVRTTTLFDVDEYVSIASPPTFWERLNNLRAVGMPGRREAERFWNDLYDRLEPWFLDPRCCKPINDFNPDQLMRDFESPLNEMTIVGFATLKRNITNPLRVDAATRVMLHLEIFHANTGRWPQSLVEAMPEEDAIDPTTGLAFLYTLSPDDKHGRPYLLKAPAHPMGPVAAGLLDAADMNPPRFGLESQ